MLRRIAFLIVTIMSKDTILYMNAWYAIWILIPLGLFVLHCRNCPGMARGSSQRGRIVGLNSKFSSSQSDRASLGCAGQTNLIRGDHTAQRTGLEAKRSQCQIPQDTFRCLEESVPRRVRAGATGTYTILGKWILDYYYYILLFDLVLPMVYTNLFHRQWNHKWRGIKVKCYACKDDDHLKSAFSIYVWRTSFVYAAVSTFHYVDKVHTEFLWNCSRARQQNATDAKEWAINQWSMTLMTHRWFFKVTKRSRARWQAASLTHAPLSLIKLFPQICWMMIFFFPLFTPYWNIKTLKKPFALLQKPRKSPKQLRQNRPWTWNSQGSHIEEFVYKGVGIV